MTEVKEWKVPGTSIVVATDTDMSASGWTLASQDAEEATPEQASPDGAEAPEEASEDVQEAFDPTKHTVPEALEYLDGVKDDSEEVQRVLEAEKNGKNRSSLLDSFKAE